MERLIEPELRDIGQLAQDMGRKTLALFRQAVDMATDPSVASVTNLKQRRRSVARDELMLQRRSVTAFTLHQPVADDFRRLYAWMRIGSLLEQIARSAYSLASKLGHVQGPFQNEWLEKIEFNTLSKQALDNLDGALELAFGSQEIEVNTLIQRDKQIDKTIDRIFPRIIAQIQEQPDRAEDFIKLMRVLKQFAKVSEMSVQIAEESVFATEGELFRHKKYLRRTGDER